MRIIEKYKFKKHNADFYCLNYLYSLRTENKLRSHEKVCHNKNFCEIMMSFKEDNVLKFNQYMNSDKMLYIIYADSQTLLKKTDGCANNLEKSSTTKSGKHILCRFLMPTITAFDNIENKHSLYRGEDCMEEFYSSLREHPTHVINCEKKKILPLTKKGLKLHQDATACYILEKDSQKSLLKIKIIEKLETIAILQVNIEFQHIVYVT